MGVLSYADDITLSCPSIWGLNDMLKICERFSVENSILFNKNINFIPCEYEINYIYYYGVKSFKCLDTGKIVVDVFLDFKKKLLTRLIMIFYFKKYKHME